MKAVILAAGRGTRMPEITKDIPKCLIEIGGKTILERQIDILREEGVNDIHVVVGYMANKVIKRVGDKANLIFNKEYASTDNIYSLYLAEKFVKSKEFILLNGDVVFDKEIIKDLLKRKEEDIAPIDSQYYDLEELKVRIKDGIIVEILPKNAPKETSDGSTIGVFKFSSLGSKLLFEEIEKIVEQGIKNKWFEYALNRVLGKIKMRATDIYGLRWIEIDTLEDIKKARKLFGE